MKDLIDIGNDQNCCKELVTAAEGGRLLAISPRTLKNWAYAKKIRHYKISNRIRFCIRDLVQFAEDRSVDVDDA